MVEPTAENIIRHQTSFYEREAISQPAGRVSRIRHLRVFAERPVLVTENSRQMGCNQAAF